MSQRVTTSFINTNIPGAPFEVNVKSNPVGVASSGNIIIIGEADGGAKYTAESLKDNWFTPDQLKEVTNKYLSGQIVDAFRALSSPSADADITGSANRIYIVKTNAGVQATATVASAYGSLTDKNFGIDGNRYFYQVTEVAAEVGASHEGTVITDFGALSGVSFTIRPQGGAESVIAVFGGAAGDYDTIAEVIALIDAALPANFSCVAGTAADSLKIESDTDATAHTKGFSKSFELIDSTPGDLAALKLTEGLYTSSQEPQHQIDIKRADTNVDESHIAEAQVSMSVGYVGTTATLTISGTTLTTTVVAGAGANLSVDISKYATIKDLADFINSRTGYTASADSGSSQSPTSQLDIVAAIGICSTAASVTPGKIKKGLSNFKTAVGQSVSLDFVATATAGLPDTMAAVDYLFTGARGATVAADIVAATIAIEGVNANFVVPLFSRDATADITDGLTDSSSTYTISATNALVKSHVLKMSTAAVRKHRSAIVSYWNDSYTEAKAEASTAASARVSVAMQKSSQVDSSGTTQSFFPWHTACIAAGMQTAGFYKPIVNKSANIISFTDPSGFDSGSKGDISGALDAGLLFLEQEVGGNKWVSDQTSYGQDTNFVYNSIQAMYAVDLVSLDLSQSFHTAFTGKSLADVDSSTALSFLASKMDSYKKQKLITASDDAPLGFKNAKVTISGPVMTVSLEIKPSTGIYFIPISIEVSQVTNSAS
jgi:hypothetical protein